MCMRSPWRVWSRVEGYQETGSLKTVKIENSGGGRWRGRGTGNDQRGQRGNRIVWIMKNKNVETIETSVIVPNTAQRCNKTYLSPNVF